MRLRPAKSDEKWDEVGNRGEIKANARDERREIGERGLIKKEENTLKACFRIGLFETVKSKGEAGLI